MAKSGLSGAFVGNLNVQYVDGNFWAVTQIQGEEFGLCVDGFGTIMPDDKFLFDFASIPRPARWLYPKTGSGKSGQYGPSAVIHDWLYSYPVFGDKKLDREFCDRVFLLGMELKQVRPTMRSLFYRAVRIGGGRYYGKPEKLNTLRK